MTKFFKYLAGFVAIGIVAGFIYWELHKKNIIKNTIENAIEKNTDSLYYIHYDSSRIDEINGNASFFNVSLQSDSEQKAVLATEDSLPNALYQINVGAISVQGLDMAGLLQKQNITAKKIALTHPVVRIINTGEDKPRPFTYKDTLELYQRILGKFKSIKTDTIQISGGAVFITNKSGKLLTSLENINISLNNFLIDQTHNYESIISYFIKDVRATVEKIQLPESKNKARINMEMLEYDAAKKIIHVNRVQQVITGNSQPLILLKNILISGLSTDAFILNRQLKAGSITCDGGLITIHKAGASKNKSKRIIEFSSELIDEAQPGIVALGKTKIIIVDPLKPGQEPFVINDVTFQMSKMSTVSDGSTISDLVGNADWQLSSSGFSLPTKDKLYRVIAGPFKLDSKMQIGRIENIIIKPLLAEQEFLKKAGRQKDRFDIKFINIELEGINFTECIRNSSLEANNINLQAVLKTSNDRTKPFDTTNKIGTYPHQLLVKMKTPIYIKTLHVRNSSVFVKETARKSALTGTVFFTNINARISNITNIKARIKEDPFMILEAQSLFLGAGKFNTEWRLPLRSTDTAFKVSGQLDKMDAHILNPMIKPFARAAIKSGVINKLGFNFMVSDYKAKGDVVFFYNDLKVELLKKDADNNLSKKGFVSFLANAIIKNDNPRNNTVRTSTVDHDRTLYKSFFDLLWRTIAAGAGEIATGKK